MDIVTRSDRPITTLDVGRRPSRVLSGHSFITAWIYLQLQHVQAVHAIRRRQWRATRFAQHTETHRLLPSRQSSYRVNHSTETAAVSTHNNIVSAIDDGKVSLLVLLNLSAAFDTVNHDTLIQMLEDSFRVNGAALGWFKSFLTDRTQTFQVVRKHQAHIM